MHMGMKVFELFRSMFCLKVQTQWDTCPLRNIFVNIYKGNWRTFSSNIRITVFFNDKCKSLVIIFKNNQNRNYF